jgi:hypothetical protein
MDTNNTARTDLHAHVKYIIARLYVFGKLYMSVRADDFLSKSMPIVVAEIH